MSDLAQLALFSRRVVPIGKKRGPIPERFREFHALNPHIYLALCMVAREYREATGRQRIGVKMLWEELRYRFALRTRGEAEYALDNSYTAYYSRLIMQREPDLADAFETRRLRSAA